MEEKRASGRAKRQKPADEGSWDCSVCTYKNPVEAYKCEMCDVRKGTSTRKPRINAQLVAQQVAQQFATPLASPLSTSPQTDEPTDGPLEGTTPLGPPPPPPKVFKKEKSASQSSNKKEKAPQSLNRNRPPRLKNVDRSSARNMSVTVGNVTVVITDYQPKRRRLSVEGQSNNNVHSDTSDTSSSASNDIHEDRHGVPETQS